MLSRESDAERIFLEAVQNCEPEQLPEFVERACEGDRDLRERVAALLKAHGTPNRLLDGGGIAATICQPPRERPGTRIGPYKLLEQIGEGGMGVVYLAEQREPLRRKVAFKIIKPGMDTRAVVARFEAERQTLALMDHPNIAKVLDAGATDAGRPYFVMELVKGTPITEFCDQHALAMQERLALFVTLCHGVQHAHQKGVIHRDLKPSNLLVEVHDVRPVPKIIDFGVAKAMGQHLTEMTFHTGFDQMVGTPLYMSPEQAGQSSLDVDTRSDIYSLGVVLYELLTGHTPFEKDKLCTVSVDELRRIIREVDPPRPSARISTLAAAELSTISGRRHLEPGKLSQELRGELDWIVMKALEKDRNRRYETVSGLAADVERYLRDEPVEACPPSNMYRLSKFSRRHRAPLIAAAAVLLGAVAVLVAMVFVSLSQRKLADQGRELADRRLKVQQGINDALTQVARFRGESLKDDQHGVTTLLHAREQAQRALALVEVGPAEDATVAQVRALVDELERELGDRQFLETLESAWLARADTDVGTSRFDDQAMIAILRQAFTDYGLPIGTAPPQEVARTLSSRPDAVREGLLAALDEWAACAATPIGLRFSVEADQVVVTHVMPGGPAAHQGQLKPGVHLVGVGEGHAGPIVNLRGKTAAEVVQLLSPAAPEITVRLEVLPPGHSSTQIVEIQRNFIRNWLRAVLDAADEDSWRQRLRQACDLQENGERRVALEILADEVDLDGQPVGALNRLATELLFVKAEERAMAILRRVQQRHPNDVWTNNILASALYRATPPQLAEAMHFYGVVVALRPDSAGAHLNLGCVLAAHGKRDEAFAEFQETLRIQPDYAGAHCSLAAVLFEQGKLEEAVAAMQEALRIQPDGLEFHSNLGKILAAQGKAEEAMAAFREALRRDPEDAFTWNALGTLLCDEVHDYVAAETAFREAIRLNPEFATAHFNLGIALTSQDNMEEGIAAYRAALRLRPADARGHLILARALNMIGQREAALAECREAVRLNPDSADARFSLAWSLSRQPGKQDEAIAEWREILRREPDNVDARNNIACILADDQGKVLEAIAEWREIVRVKPDFLIAHCNLAQRLSDTADEASRDLVAALSHALKAVELAPTHAIPWFTLGVVHYRSGRWEESIAALNKSAELGPVNLVNGDEGQTDAQRCLFLAMAHWRLGDHDAARKWYDRAAVWMKDNPADKDTGRYRAEAEELLRVNLESATPMDESKTPSLKTEKSDRS